MPQASMITGEISVIPQLSQRTIDETPRDAGRFRYRHWKSCAPSGAQPSPQRPVWRQ